MAYGPNFKALLVLKAKGARVDVWQGGKALYAYITGQIYIYIIYIILYI